MIEFCINGKRNLIIRVDWIRRCMFRGLMTDHALFSVNGAVITMGATKNSFICAAIGIRTKYFIVSLFFIRMMLVLEQEMTLWTKGGGGKGAIGIGAVVHGK